MQWFCCCDLTYQGGRTRSSFGQRPWTWYSSNFVPSRRMWSWKCRDSWKVKPVFVTIVVYRFTAKIKWGLFYRKNFGTHCVNLNNHNHDLVNRSVLTRSKLNHAMHNTRYSQNVKRKSVSQSVQQSYIFYEPLTIKFSYTNTISFRLFSYKNV